MPNCRIDTSMLIVYSEGRPWMQRRIECGDVFILLHVLNFVGHDDSLVLLSDGSVMHTIKSSVVDYSRQI